ncbi:CPBP family intramembrane metalloprotease [Dactylosporangium vinaceum]|uniref:CPBP family intramembrane glutamic endopeptidase n=1 Tax=Dactylosporangium vinaceum TaxID=53362 RepID=A0ABV5M1S2_9ACTN|nr:CPBP family intramembrane glutamic endopeptidase [Dactylosporangium vinaceum]UAB99271.1 CPBP family intramembrane metalloprotease [Dactylosporangium vinaceum]
MVAEFILVFFALPVAFAFVKIPGGPIPILLVLCIAVAFSFRRARDFDRRDLWRPSALRPALPSILRLWALAAVVAVAAVGLFDRSHLFDLPRHNPGLWVLIVVAYPIVSVYPQELLFRAFLLHRYRTLLRNDRIAAATSAVSFALAHLLFGNPVAVALTLVGGWLFARRYQRTRSLLTVGVEHAAYGLLIFTVGLGRFFYHGPDFG